MPSKKLQTTDASISCIKFSYDLFSSLLIFQIYSVVNNKIRCFIVIKIIHKSGDTEEVNINEDLIKQRMAEPAEEGFLSKVVPNY